MLSPLGFEVRVFPIRPQFCPDLSSQFIEVLELSMSFEGKSRSFLACTWPTPQHPGIALDHGR